MNARFCLIIPILFLNYFLSAQLVSGPMLGYIEHREAVIWMEVGKEAKKVELKYAKATDPKSVVTLVYNGELGNMYNPIKFELKHLDMNTAYKYSLLINGSPIKIDFPTEFKTKELWEWRKNAPDFCFLTGSCVYVNDTAYDRPGKPYGNSMQILETMANEKTEFMIWQGDNLYFREADFSSKSGMDYRYSYNFSKPEFQKLRGTRANYAIWDDHDYGPNDSNSSYELKEHALKLFKDYWPNKSYGEEDNKGVYHKFTWGDVDFFMMDDRYHRYSNLLLDSINGTPNKDKIFYGKKQMDWLKNGLLTSKATFKIIVNGGQVLNKMADKECLIYFPTEWNELMSFIDDMKVRGILFLTGDRHYSEVIKHEMPNSYSLYEFTCSSITSGIHNISNTPEGSNPQRVPNMLGLENNYGKISVTGPDKNRKISMQSINKEGKVLFTFELSEHDLKNKRKK